MLAEVTVPDDERLGLRYAVACEPGRRGEQWDRDAAYAGPYLLAVAAGVEHMSTPVSPGNLAIDVLRSLDVPTEAVDLAPTLEQGVARVRETFGNLLESDPGWEGSAAYLTALLWRDTCMAIAHAGSTAAYLLRDGELVRLTKDHSVGQLRIDAGEIAPSEVDLDPQNKLVVRYVEGKDEEFPDIALHDVVQGDRYLICVGEVLRAMSQEAIGEIMADVSRSPESVASALIGKGSSDEPYGLTAVVADVVRREDASGEVKVKFAGRGRR